MKPLADLQFIRDRVLAEIRATPPAGPPLVEAAPTPATEARSETCRRGHAEWVVRARQRVCLACARESQRRRRMRP